MSVSSISVHTGFTQPRLHGVCFAGSPLPCMQRAWTTGKPPLVTRYVYVTRGYAQTSLDT